MLLPIVVIFVGWIYKPQQYTKPIKYSLIALRSLSILAIALLLFQLSFNQVDREIKKPKLLMLLDNSESMKLHGAVDLVYDSLKQEVEKQFGEQYELEYLSFSEDLKPASSLDFNGQFSNLDKAISELPSYYNLKDIHAALVVSDGNFNNGRSINFINLPPVPFYSIGVGDTTSNYDLALSSISANKTTYVNNEFPVQISWTKSTSLKENAEIQIYNKSREVLRKKVELEGNAGVLTVFLKENELGNKLYRAELKSSATEENLNNNQAFFSVEVLNNKKRLLLTYDALSPEIGMLNQVLNNYEEIELSLVSLQKLSKAKLAECDAVVILLSKTPTQSQLQLLSEYPEKGKMVFLRSPSQAELLSKLEIIPKISWSAYGAQENLVYPKRNESYVGLNLSESWTQYNQLNPLKIHVGTPEMANAYKTVFFQKLGSLETKNPLLSVAQFKGAQVVVSLAWDWWRLRMSFYESFASHQAFDDFMGSMCKQVLEKPRKDVLEFFLPNSFYERRNQVAKALVYNSQGQPVENATVSLKITGGEQSLDLDMVPSSSGYFTNLDGLKAGEYNYTVSTEVEGKQQQKVGSFVVLPGNLELLQKAADYQSLKALALNSGAAFASVSSRKDVLGQLSSTKALARYKVNKSTKSIIDFKIILFLLTVLLAAEWLIRKYNGRL